MHFLPTVYVHLRRNRLCLCECSSKRHHFMCNSPLTRRKRVLARCETRFFCVCMLQCLCSEIRPSRVLSCVVRFIHMSALLLLPHIDIFGTFYETCSKCIIAYVLPVHMYASNLLTTHYRTMFWLNLFPNRPSLAFSSRFYSLTNMSIDFRHSFCRSKRVFVRHRLVVVGEKNVGDDNYDKLFVNEINTA